MGYNKSHYVKVLTKFIEEIRRCRAKGEKTVNLDRKNI